MSLRLIRKKEGTVSLQWHELFGYKQEVCDRINQCNLSLMEHFCQSVPPDQSAALHILGCEYKGYVSFRIIKERSKKERDKVPDSYSMVWNLSDGLLCNLSDFMNRKVAFRYRKWQFYLAPEKLRVYRIKKNRRKVIHRDFTLSMGNDIKAVPSS